MGARVRWSALVSAGAVMVSASGPSGCQSMVVRSLNDGNGSMDPKRRGSR